MTAAAQGTSGGGWFSKLVIVALLALAVGLYLQIVMLQPGGGESETPPLASAQPVQAEAPPATEGEPTKALQDLPEDQMEVIRRVFAPEIGN